MFPTEKHVSTQSYLLNKDGKQKQTSDLMEGQITLVDWHTP